VRRSKAAAAALTPLRSRHAIGRHLRRRDPEHRCHRRAPELAWLPVRGRYGIGVGPNQITDIRVWHFAVLRTCVGAGGAAKAKQSSFNTDYDDMQI
jgi:hypothetical protein